MLSLSCACLLRSCSLAVVAHTRLKLHIVESCTAPLAPPRSAISLRRALSPRDNRVAGLANTSRRYKTHTATAGDIHTRPTLLCDTVPRPSATPATATMLGFHHFGTFLLFAATILLLVSTITSPVVDGMAIAKVRRLRPRRLGKALTSTSQASLKGLNNAATVNFGALGYCIVVPK